MDLQEKGSAAQPSYETMKSVFHTALHEIGTPINGVVTASLLLKSEIDSGNTEFAQELLQMIFSAANNLNEIYERVKQVVRQESAEKFRLTETAFDFRNWLDNLLQSMLALFMEKNISVVKQVPKEFPCVIFADKVYLTQIVYNILMNALKYSPESTVVAVSCFTDQDRFYIEITDQGIGIPEAELPLIFKEYHQVATDVRSRFGGIGLGLSIVKELTGIMGGVVTVKSEAGAGSTFTIVLPLKQVNR